VMANQWTPFRAWALGSWHHSGARVAPALRLALE
jgi:hypothetical protein